MADDKFLLVSMDDERAKSLSEVLSNKTCKKIIEHLAEKDESSEKDISLALKIPLNTVEYNIKKLLKSGFVQKHKNFFWSKKGKKILMYELTNKSIVISPRKSGIEKIRSVLPSFILLVAGTFALFVYDKILSARESAQGLMAQVPEAGDFAASAMDKGSEVVLSSSSNPIWPWFFLGGLLVLVIFALVNWRKL